MIKLNSYITSENVFTNISSTQGQSQVPFLEPLKNPEYIQADYRWEYDLTFPHPNLTQTESKLNEQDAKDDTKDDVKDDTEDGNDETLNGNNPENKNSYIYSSATNSTKEERYNAEDEDDAEEEEEDQEEDDEVLDLLLNTMLVMVKKLTKISKKLNNIQADIDTIKSRNV